MKEARPNDYFYHLKCSFLRSEKMKKVRDNLVFLVFYSHKYPLKYHPLSPSKRSASEWPAQVEVPDGRVAAEGGLGAVLSEDDAGVGVEAEGAVAHAGAGAHEGVDAPVVELAAHVEGGGHLAGADLE